MKIKLSNADQQRAEYLLYNEQVRKLTERTFKREFIDNKNLRGKGWSLDHRLSVKECFLNEVPVEMASHVCNLEMVPTEYNLSKGSKSTITFTELIELVTEYEDN